jgi:hypothetical protein
MKTIPHHFAGGVYASFKENEEPLDQSEERTVKQSGDLTILKYVKPFKRICYNRMA